MGNKPGCIALIPARQGSKRLPGKNVKMLAGHPLIAYTICAARQSGVFSDVAVSTDSPEYADIAVHYGARVPFLRPEPYAADLSPDIEWVTHMIEALGEKGEHYDCFSLLRPTSPFRQPETICRAWAEFSADPGADSLRAVEKCSQHPGKMWVLRGGRIVPLLTIGPEHPPWHSSQYQALPEVWVQNASLEIAWTRVVYQYRSIAGHQIIPFMTEGFEGLDINRDKDWWYAEHLLQEGQARLPEIDVRPYEIPVKK